MTSVLTVDFYSDTLSEYMDVRVIMPTLENGKNARVLYLLHGLSDAPSVWLHRTNLERYAEAVGNLCVVLVSGHRSWYANTASGLAYRTFVFEEIPRKIENMFRVSTRREDTFVAGNSMGGYGAIRNGLKYAENFGCVIGLSAALVHDTWKDADNSAPIFTFRRNYYEAVFGEYDKVKGSDKDPKALLLKLKEEGRPVPKMYLCCGTEDGLVTANRDFRDFLNENGVDLTYVEGPGKHDWVFWDTYIKKVLDWLPLNRTGAGINSGNVK